ncbi:helix-turn-helix domain-containing protein [Sediminibacterium sp.]|jgi:transcriptional regulator with XRE-family HTH domain|uniref:helix-turn-helix domain-containing protein n=1 Tax=Sediminibacterium sp. TaxID=1917865 RepID=UPI003F71081B
MNSTLNSELLASMIKSKRGKKGLRETADEINQETGHKIISAATLSRIEQGNLPDVETFIRLCKWLRVSTDEFVTSKDTVQKEITEKDKLVYQLRSSQELDADSINAMVAMVDMAFGKLKKSAKK